MKSRLLVLFTALLTACGLVWAVNAAEPWADPHLPVRAGLTLWLDASRQNAARKEQGLPALKDNAGVDVWFDGSGREVHLTQGLVEARPHFRPSAESAAIAFDGKAEFLEAANLHVAFTNATLFIYGAPISNVGGFRGLLAINEFGRNDYNSGFTVDLGPGGTANFGILNVEGAGFGGAANLLKGQRAFGDFHTLGIATSIGPAGTRLLLDGEEGSARERTPSLLKMDQLTVGTRRYSNDPKLSP